MPGTQAWLPHSVCPDLAPDLLGGVIAPLSVSLCLGFTALKSLGFALMAGLDTAEIGQA